MKQKRVFILDDDIDFAESLAETLHANGHHVERAYSGKAAIECMTSNDFDIAFLDVKMAGMNGVETFLEIKKIRPDIQVYMMTGYADEGLLKQATDNGVLEVLDKPLDIAKVLAAIESVKPARVVMLADDDLDFAESTKEVLTAAGYKVHVARDGETAVQKVINTRVDALLLDLRMPLMSGHEVYLELMRQGCVVPTLIVTGHASEESEEISMLRSLSVTGCLVKPFEPGLLLESIEMMVDRK